MFLSYLFHLIPKLQTKDVAIPTLPRWKWKQWSTDFSMLRHSHITLNLMNMVMGIMLTYDEHSGRHWIFFPSFYKKNQMGDYQVGKNQMG